MRWGGGDGEVGLTKGLENALEVGPNPGRRGGSARVGDLGEALLVAVPAGAVGGGAVAVAVARVAPGRGGGARARPPCSGSAVFGFSERAKSRPGGDGSTPISCSERLTGRERTMCPAR